MINLHLERTDEVEIFIHGFGSSAFDSLPGETMHRNSSIWKKMIFGDVTLTCFLDGVPK